MQTLTRRTLFGLTLATTTATLAATAQAGNRRYGSDRDPRDLIPRWFSVNRFLRLSKAQVYQVDRAVRLGRRIIIDGYTPSESRELISLANKDLAAAHAILRQGQ